MTWIDTVARLLAWLPAEWVSIIVAVLVWVDDLLPRGGRGLDPEVIGTLILMAGVPCALLLAEAAWAILRGLLPGLSVEPRRALLGAVAATVRRGGRLEVCLRAEAPHLPVPWSRRAFAAAARVEAGAALVPVLVQEGLVPTALLASGQAAWDQGAEALADWCEEQAARPQQEERLRRVGADLAWQGAAAIIVLAFVAGVIHPKLCQIAEENGLPARLPFGAELLLAVVRPWPLLVGILLVVMVAAAAIIAGRRIGWQRRRLGGRFLLRAAAAGRSEAAIAADLVRAGVAAPAVLAAGAAGSFAGLCRACGWMARDPDGLLVAMAREERNRHRRRAVLILVLGILAPLVLAVPVVILGLGVFGLQTTLLWVLGP